ncbi:hypothetical protein J8273_3756 [Carpediemonas membranifera]|uniref:Uncharacterized protein n=1 Tax=Carpediemonas membranifera TaxID=201153 RepID=A0A8J6E096_9EUKA|nr:hypothetical protein J8273_3756 [Carpediemonas membranifera]|eukprot:KAG9394779.1 hypothetical protein J8273_3756 [Carpediemonas membranifera]
MSGELVTSIGKGVIVNMTSSFLSSGASTIAGCAASSCNQCPNFGSCQSNTTSTGGNDFFTQDFSYDNATSGGFSSSSMAAGVVKLNTFDAPAASGFSGIRSDNGMVHLDMDSLVDLGGPGFEDPIPMFAAKPKPVPKKQAVDATCVAHGFALSSGVVDKVTLNFFLVDDVTEVEVQHAQTSTPTKRTRAMRRGSPVDLADIVIGGTLALDDQVFFIDAVDQAEAIMERRRRGRHSGRGAGLLALL